MSIFFASYIANFIALGILGILFLRKYLNLSGVFFMIFCFWTGLWFIFYFLTYFWADSHNTLILFAQLSYATSIVALYSFLLFLYYFPKKKTKILHPILFIFVLFSIFVYALYVTTPYVIDGLYFNELKNDWYEIEWILFPYHLTLSFLFIPLSIILWGYSLKNSYYIERKRIQYILMGMLTFVLLTFIFLLILPMFWLWAMEKYIAFFFLPFVFWVFYAIRHYDFLNFKIISIHFFIFLYSILSSFLILKIIKNYSEYTFSSRFHQYWWTDQWGLFVNLFIGIWLYVTISFLLRKKLAPYIERNYLWNTLEKMKNYIPFITNMDSLNLYLQKEFLENFNMNYVLLNTEYYDKYLFNYFEKDISRNLFMNDVTFIHENKNRFKKIKKYKEWSAYLFFPLRGTDDRMKWLFEVWKKSFNDPFFTFEIKELQSFSKFLQWHLKYLSIYKEIQDISINLDKKVDEKTIEYNTLLSKQKEFIRYVGHEIKNPITNAIFLCDWLRDEIWDMKNEKNSKIIQEDWVILYQELIKVSELIKHIFSTEQFDLNKIKLYKKEINIREFLSVEIKNLVETHLNVNFWISLDDVWNVEIDEIQMRQVLHNLVINAIKFSDDENPRVNISLEKIDKNIFCLSIEDNGKGFNEIDSNEVFDKYSTGGGNSVWLWMWLYLCQKTIELHGWKIWSSNSDALGWAKFTIII